MPDLDTLSREVAAAGDEWMVPGVRMLLDGHRAARVVVRNRIFVEATLPDFNDAATRGVLLGQVRERWDDPWMCVAWTGANVYGWAVRDRDGKMLVWGHDSETAALVAALEAAPKR